ncbi:unnamed protein product [Nesidiocoris tenuis]|uniref:Cytochrome P450 n=1 Tax=Nesidiocoris tenuis TaxID=355587 RepID=A0A6H5FZ03_9HEMI|nr:unnamed protein product [Nesidiocoris tenuis]
MNPLLLFFVSILLVSAILLIVLYTTFYVPSLKQLLVFRRLPGPRYFPVIGAAYELPFVGYAGVFKWLKATAVDRFKRICSVWMMGLPVVFINSPQDIEVILSSMKCIDKGEEYLTLKTWLNEGLLLSTGNKWHVRRKLLTPTFHFRILEDKAPTMITSARRFVDKLLGEGGKPFDPFDKVSRCTLDVVCEAAMGVKLNAQNNQSSHYVATIKRVSKAVIYRILNMQFLSQWLWNITPAGIRNNKDTKILHDFTNKGHDTTAALILFALFELGHHPEIQERAYQEQFEIFGDDPRDPTFSDIKCMTYLELLIKECLRLYPSVPYFSRRLGEDLHLKDLPPVPSGSNVVIMPIFLHRNPDYYPQPERFDPDRFLPDECTKRHPFAYIPFSAGPRNCIGEIPISQSPILTKSSKVGSVDQCRVSGLLHTPRRGCRMVLHPFY